MVSICIEKTSWEDLNCKIASLELVISASHTTFMPSCHGHLTNATDLEAWTRNVALDF